MEERIPLYAVGIPNTTQWVHDVLKNEKAKEK